MMRIIYKIPIFGRWLQEKHSRPLTLEAIRDLVTTSLDDIPKERWKEMLGDMIKNTAFKPPKTEPSLTQEEVDAYIVRCAAYKKKILDHPNRNKPQ